MYPKRHTNGFFLKKKLFILVSVSVSDILQGTEWFGLQFGGKWLKPNQTKLPHNTSGSSHSNTTPTHTSQL